MSLATAAHLGPYEILAPLGAGGMGEVYRARDTRLERTVALKVLPEDLLEGEERRQRFEREARTLASLNHPNIATIYSFEEIEGRHVLTMELLEGESLRDVILRRRPTVRQVLSWALQAAQGLAAAHAKGIVHRDIKPENLFLTTDGRLKVLDFGLAKLTARTPVDRDAATESGLSVPGVIVGTVAYMSPEQIEAEGLDPRSDVFSLGVVLYELLAREHPFRRPTMPATLTAIVNETPLALSARLPELLPGVDRAIGKCLEKRCEERYQSAQELAAVLEMILQGGASTAAPRDVEEKSPYPGLSSFTEADSGRFFGREEEVTALWRKLHDRKLLAVIGPSGAGKTSFARAGAVAARPKGWAAIVATPGNAPLRGLARALGPQLASDPEALRDLADFEEGDTGFRLISRWRRSHEDVLLVVDQFEELFTLNPPETQARFATLLGRLAGEADVHVLLSLRDDFLMRCHAFEDLGPVFRELTPLGPMTREGLRQALVEPAAERGYRFEDEGLVDEMIGAVEGVRGALPLLAFAVSRLWEKRDVEKKVLTREAYREVGGVEGALARHAEETMERIGAAMEPTVRDLFRNLTTAQGTRAALDREELLSALPDRAAAEGVLTKLIDARLLTSWETEAMEGQPARRRVEIVHESLLSAWPRLVRWQTQDADGAQLRDQLRQAAHLWEERGKADDLLWTGSSYLDYRVWRGRYPGKLSSLEENFAGSMAALAGRKRRRRRTAVGSVVVALALGLGAVAWLWSRAEGQRTRAEAASMRAEASKLLALAQLEVDTDPAAALAYATKSVELDDTQAARFFALRVTQAAPVASELPGVRKTAFSPDGEWLAATQSDKIVLLNQDGRDPVAISPAGLAPGTLGQSGSFLGLVFGPDGKSLSLGFRDELRILSVPDGREVRRVKYDVAAGAWWPFGVARKAGGSRWTFFRRPWDGGEQSLIGELEFNPQLVLDFNRDLTVMAYPIGRKVYVRSPLRWSSPPRLLAERPTEVIEVSLSYDGRRLATVEKSGEIRIWDTASTSGQPIRVLPAPGAATVAYGPVQWLVSDSAEEGRTLFRLWDLAAPPGAGPLLLRTKVVPLGGFFSADPRGRACTVLQGKLLFWPLSPSRPRVFDFPDGRVWTVAFTADGSTLVASTNTGALRAWPLSAGSATAFRALPEMKPLSEGGSAPAIAPSPTRREVAVVAAKGRVRVMPLDGGKPRDLEGPSDRGIGFMLAVAYSPDGRRVAAAPLSGTAKEKRIRVWDLDTGAVQMLEPVADADDRFRGGFVRLSFVGEDRIVAGVNGGAMLFDLRSGKGKVLTTVINNDFSVDRSGRVGVGLACGAKPPCEVVRLDLDGGAPVSLGYRGDWPVLDSGGTVVASSGSEGTIQVGPISGGEPHLLFGHKGAVNLLAFSPDGKWIASAGDDSTVRLWPVPDMKEVPPHKRSHEEFLATLKTFTNIRAIPDAKAPNGWKLEPGPFPGWKTAPQW